MKSAQKKTDSPLGEWWESHYLTTKIGIGLVMTGILSVNFGSFWIGMVTLVIGYHRELKGLGGHPNHRAVVQQLLAHELGFVFRPRGPVNVFGWGNKFQLTRVAMATAEFVESEADQLFGLVANMLPNARNILSRETSNMEVAVFDFASNPAKKEMQTVVAIKSDELRQPYWRLEPKSVLKDLPDELMKNSTVAHRFILTTGQRDVFDTVLVKLEDCISDDMTLESGEGFLLLYRVGQLADSEIIRGMLEMAATIHEKLATHFKPEESTELYVQSATQKEAAY